MARPPKCGVDYFPLDVNMSDSVRLVEAEFGLNGFAVIIKLYQKIYGGHGYYCKWNEEVALLFASDCKLGGNAVSEIVASCIKRGVFNGEIFKKHGVLTSEGIQERYLEMVKRRTDFEILPQYALVKCASSEVSVDNNAVNVDNNAKNASNNPQSKVNKSKVNKSKSGVDNTVQKRKRFVPPTLDEVQDYCFERNNGVDAQRFIDYYTANGWLVGKNKMKDWRAAVRTWERNGTQQQKAQPQNGYDTFMSQLAEMRE